MFVKHDADGSGAIDRPELVEVLRELKLPCGKVVVRQSSNERTNEPTKCEDRARRRRPRSIAQRGTRRFEMVVWKPIAVAVCVVRARIDDDASLTSPVVDDDRSCVMERQPSPDRTRARAHA